MKQHNLYAALRAAFPAILDATAIETDSDLAYTWRDLERGTAMLANLIDALALPAESRIAVQVDKSVEALMLYLAVLRAGHVYLPLNSAYQAAEGEDFIRNAEPAGGVRGADPSTPGGKSPPPGHLVDFRGV